MADRRRRHHDDEDDFKRRRMPGGDGRDIGPQLVDLISKVDEECSGSVETALEKLATDLVGRLETMEAQIIDILSDCVAYLPEKITIFTTLSGLLNAKSSSFGESLVSRLISDLKSRLDGDEYEITVRIFTFLMDLANARVVTFDSAVEFCFNFLNAASEPNLLSDFYVFCVMRSLAWIGAELLDRQSDQLTNLLDKIEKYLLSRPKHHIKILGVWEEVETHEQEDYLDCLWAQLQKLRDDSWLERHISRYYTGFASKLEEAIAVNLSTITLPQYDQNRFTYPFPRMVFRLFAYTDCPDDEPVMPGSHAIERFLVEEDLNCIIDNNRLNVRLCTKELLNYKKKETVPLNYVIVEVVFSQLFRLPKPPNLELFYGALLIDLCRVKADSMPQVLAQAAELLFQRAKSLHPACLDRLIDWFSYHLSNFQYRWSWSEWQECVDFPEYDRRRLFVSEVLEKCLRFAYHSKLTQVLPEEFGPLIPSNPTIVYVLDEPTHPAYDQAQLCEGFIRERKTSKEVLFEMRVDRLSDKDEYDPDMVAVFTAALLNMASATFSHTFSAFMKYIELFRKVCIGNRDMQATILRTIYDCWSKKKQMLIVLVDKLTKMRIVEPVSVVAWVFCEDMKNEFHRSWVWEVLNVAVGRQDCQIGVVADQLKEMKQHLIRKEKFGDLMEPSEGTTEEDVENKKLELKKLEDDLRELLLLVIHNFTVALSEMLVELNDAMDPSENTLRFQLALGRFKQVFLANPEALWRHSDMLHEKLFSSAKIDQKILEVYNEFRSLKCS